MTAGPHYHHGDLRRAVLAAALGAARVGGPAAISLASLAKEQGVTVPALYRHFRGRDDLVAVVAMLAQAELARFIENRCDSGTQGEALLRVVGMSYIGFARAEPGWFATAFTVPPDLSRAGDETAAGQSGRTPFQLLGDALDHMVTGGQLARAARPGAEIACWAAVHGFAELAVHGPLRTVPSADLDALAARTVETAVRGILAP